MQGKIEATNPSQSGKTLGVKIGDTWYSTKHFELQNMVGQTITFQTSSSEFNGRVMHWLNDYTIEGQQPTTADQAFNQAYAQQGAGNYTQPTPTPVAPPPQPSIAPPPSAYTQPELPPAGHKNREASIVAQTLTKICSSPGDDPESVWGRYVAFYTMYLAWDGKPVPKKPVQQSRPPTDEYDPDDEIPF